MSRRDKRGRVLEIPLPFDSSKVNCPEGAREGGLGHLVTFCLHRKSLARGRNILFHVQFSSTNRRADEDIRPYDVTVT